MFSHLKHFGRDYKEKIVIVKKGLLLKGLKLKLGHQFISFSSTNMENKNLFAEVHSPGPQKRNRLFSADLLFCTFRSSQKQYFLNTAKSAESQ